MGGSQEWGKKVPLMIQLVFKENSSVASKLAQRVRGRSPLMQGKRQYIRKINRKARGMGETRKQGGLSPSSTSFGRESLGWRQGCSEAASKICSPGAEKGGS